MIGYLLMRVNIFPCESKHAVICVHLKVVDYETRKCTIVPFRTGLKC